MMKKVWRAVVLMSLVVFSTPGWSQNITIDIFGANGLSPKDGDCCVLLPKSTNPKRGDDAIPGTPGQDAFDLNLNLKDNGSNLNGHIVVYGTIHQDGRAYSQINKTMNLGASVFINAYGGTGARGGIGGQGQDGCDGIKGENATKTSKGKMGGTGCNSGGGGDAAAAQPGGDGGQIKVYIPSDQTHLALLVSADVRKGSGGKPGRPGYPGEPGARGEGGDKLTYLSHYEDEPACAPVESYNGGSGGSGGGMGGGGFGGSGGGSMGGGGSGGGGGIQDLGNGFDSFESNANPDLFDFLKSSGQFANYVLNNLVGVGPAYACGGKTPIYKTQSAGEPGKPGQPGPMGGGDTRPGKDGEDGDLEFIVVNPNGSEVSYKKPFDLKLLSYNIVDSAPGGNGDGIFEPNEIITITNLRVKNDSAMPSPEMADVIISL